jgi:hypothetical protein
MGGLLSRDSEESVPYIAAFMPSPDCGRGRARPRKALFFPAYLEKGRHTVGAIILSGSTFLFKEDSGRVRPRLRVMARSLSFLPSFSEPRGRHPVPMSKKKTGGVLARILHLSIVRGESI